MGFCNDITSSCDVCFEITYGKCNDVFTLSLGLTPLTTFFLKLIDKFDIVTLIEVTSEANGDLNITQTWTEFFGAVEIQIFSDPARTTIVEFTESGVTYNCIVAQSGGITSSPIICPLTMDFSFTCNSQYSSLL